MSMAADKQRRNRGRPWKPGESGNPRGRPPKQESLTSLLKEELDRISPEDTEGRTWRELIVLATLRLACQGNRAALQEIWNRSDGKVTKEIELTDNSSEGLQDGTDGATNTLRDNQASAMLFGLGRVEKQAGAD